MGFFGKKDKDKFSLETVCSDGTLMQNVIDSLKGNDIDYEIADDGTYVKTFFQGDDLKILIFIKIIDETKVVAFDAPLEFEVELHKTGDALARINEINNDLHFGAFSVRENRVWFRYHLLPYKPIDEKVVLGVLRLVKETVDAHDGELAENLKRSSSFDVMYG